MARVPCSEEENFIHQTQNLNYITDPKTTKLPAVVVPLFLNTGFNFAKSETEAFGRIPSSTEIVTGVSSPVFGSTIFNRRHQKRKRVVDIAINGYPSG